MNIIDDEYCTKCGLETASGFAMTCKGYSYCPECWYCVMNALGIFDRDYDKLDDTEEINQRSKAAF